jgi:hypothetical protein
MARRVGRVCHDDAVFGIAQPCRHTLEPHLHREWMSHLCGVCLGLRDHAGQSARVTTNVDAVVLSVLVAAQRPAGSATRRAGPCPGRGGRTQVVPRSSDDGVVLAVATSLTMAATKVDDHVLDRDGAWTRVPVLPRAVARRWRGRGDVAGAAVGFDTGRVREAVARSNELEQSADASFDVLAGPTEDAVGMAFAHTAVVAGRLANTDALDALGRAFGRIVYLLDAVEDFDDDVAHGRFNPLSSYADAVQRRAEARRLFRAAHGQLVDAFERLELEPARQPLVRALVVDQVARAGRRVLHGAGHLHCVSSSADAAASIAPHAPVARRARQQPARALVELGLAGLATVTAGAFAFKPGEGPIPPEGIPPVPPGQPGQPHPPGRVGDAVGDTAADVGSDCFCAACCDCCDCCDACDGCDGCCDCDCS